MQESVSETRAKHVNSFWDIFFHYQQMPINHFIGDSSNKHYLFKFYDNKKLLRLFKKFLI